MRRWKPVLIGVGVFLGLIIAFVVWINVVAARRWAETLHRAKEIQADLAAPISGRAPLRGEPLPGNAWDDYKVASDLAHLIPAPKKGKSSYGSEYLRFLRDGADADLVEVRSVLQKQEAAIARLRLGARRSELARTGHEVWKVDTVLDALRVQARLAATEGRAGEAFALAIEGFWIHRDLAFVRVVNGDVPDLDYLISILGTASAEPAAFEALERDLSTLERTLPPPGGFLLGYLCEILRYAEREGPFGFAVGFGGLGGRHGWSSRLYFAGAADRIEAWARSLSDARDRPWPEALALWDEAKAEADGSRNGLLSSASTAFREEMNHWLVLAKLRVARAGAHFRASGEKLFLDDPFGGTLIWDEEGVRSRGATDDPKDDIILRLKP